MKNVMTTCLVARRLLAVLLMGCAVAGCQEEVKKAKLDYAELPSDAVVMTVNGHKLTKAMLEREVAFQMALNRISNPRKRDDAQERNKLLVSYEQQFLRNSVLTDYGMTNSVVNAPDEVANAEKRLAKVLFRGNGTPKRLRKEMSADLEKMLTGYVERECYVQKSISKIKDTHVKPATDEEVAKRRAYFESYNHRCQATNAVLWVEASNIWKRVRNDTAEWDKVVEEFESTSGPHKSAISNMGEIEPSFFDDEPEMKAYLVNMKEGDVTPPMVGDNGLMIAKLLDRRRPNTQEGKDKIRYVLARIYFELPEFWEPQTDDELRADIETISKNDAFAETYKSLVDTATISYPCGTNIFDRIKQELRSRGPRDRRPSHRGLNF